MIDFEFIKGIEFHLLERTGLTTSLRFNNEEPFEKY